MVGRWLASTHQSVRTISITLGHRPPEEHHQPQEQSLAIIRPIRDHLSGPLKMMVIFLV